MSQAVVEFPDGMRATYNESGWTAGDPDLERHLNEVFTLEAYQLDNPFAYIPNAVSVVASFAADALGGTVIETPAPPEAPDGAIY